MKVVIAGGSGALGSRLAGSLAAGGTEVVVLSRGPGTPSGHREVLWDGVTVGRWAEELVDANVVNLAGALVDRRPTAANIDLLARSRVQPTRALLKAMEELPAPVPVFVQASTAAIYGDAGETAVDETSPPADGPPQMAGVARAWEHASIGARAISTMVLRTSIVLDANTPALDRLTALARCGVGGRVGTGRQWVSWIHIADWLAIVAGCLDGTLTPAASERQIVVASAPHPVRNAELMRELRRCLHRPAAPPTPAWLVRIGAAVLRTDPALALTGRHTTSQVLARIGFQFKFPTLSAALTDLLDPALPH